MKTLIAVIIFALFIAMIPSVGIPLALMIILIYISRNYKKIIKDYKNLKREYYEIE